MLGAGAAESRAPRSAARATRRACLLARAAAAALAAVAAAACSPYDPSLPPTPFVCADDEPRWPDGYVCVGDPDGRRVCRAASAAVDGGVADSALRASDAAVRGGAAGAATAHQPCKFLAAALQVAASAGKRRLTQRRA